MYIYNEKESKQQKRWHTMNEALTPIGQENQPQLKVLVIDDEENIIDLIKLGLKYEGFQVESASDGSEGLAAAQRIDPNVIILDLMLPGMDGLEVMRRLRMNPTTRDIPVLMLTAKDEVQDRVTGLETGADDYLAKPFSFDEFVARIRAIFGRKKRRNAEDGTDLTQSQILQFGDLQLKPETPK